VTGGMIVAVQLFGGFTVVFAVLAFAAGFSFHRVRTRWFCFAVCILGLLPLHATVFFTLPLSIWALVVLFNVEVTAIMRGYSTVDELDRSTV